MFIETYVLLEPLNSVLENHYFTIMSVITGLYVGLLAFMYPRIIDFKSKIQNEFVFFHVTAVATNHYAELTRLSHMLQL